MSEVNETENYSLGETIRIVSDAAKLMGLQTLFVCVRQNWQGDVVSVSDTAVLLRNARIFQNTGPLDSTEVQIHQQPPQGIITLALDSIEAAFIGKPEPRK